MCTFLRNDLLEVYYCDAAIILQNCIKRNRRTRFNFVPFTSLRLSEF